MKKKKKKKHAPVMVIDSRAALVEFFYCIFPEVAKINSEAALVLLALNGALLRKEEGMMVELLGIFAQDQMETETLSGLQGLVPQ